MITREPKPGDKIEYQSHKHDPSQPEGAHERYFGSGPVPPGCDTANNGFIWRFKDTNNILHRIVGAETVEDHGDADGSKQQ